MNKIDYKLIDFASDHYARCGYKHIEVPWYVPRGIVQLTKPIDQTREEFTLNDGKNVMIASGEQGFLQLLHKGVLTPGKYQTVTPCFRDDPEDQFHCKQFMKLELIEVLDTQDVDTIREHTNKTIICARTLFEDLASPLVTIIDTREYRTGMETRDPTMIPGTHTADINAVIDGQHIIELGSYGARRASFASWIYGTGLALPRFMSACYMNSFK